MNDELMAGYPDECPHCDGSGQYEERHPELDDVLMQEVWLVEYCSCEAGQNLRDRHESEMEAAQNNI